MLEFSLLSHSDVIRKILLSCFSPSVQYVAHKVVVDLKKVSLELSNENGS